MKAYVIVQGCGEYSDRLTWPARVYRRKESAEAAMAVLEKTAAFYQKKVEDKLYSWDVADDRASADYAWLGFEAKLSHDWELNECELVD